jgi:hypothetical protein
MPHDRNGNLIQVGDMVMIPCKIKEVHLTEDYCNVNLETKEEMYPTRDPSHFSLNSKQVVKPFLNEHGELVIHSPLTGSGVK